MNTMTKEEARNEANEIVDFLFDKLKDASEKGPDHVLHFLTASSFALGSVVAIAVDDPAGIGPILSMSIDKMTDGLQSGMQAKGMSGTFLKIVKD